MSNPPSIPPIVPPPGPSFAPGNAGPTFLAPKPPKRRLWLTLLLVFLVFLGGAGVGVFATVILSIRRAQALATNPELATQRLATVIKRRLNLDPTQTAELQTILTNRQKRLQNLRSKIQPEVDLEMEATRADITALLRPGQRQKWDTAYADIKARWMNAP